MPGSWMADTSEEEEHPTVPLGINEMTIPRIALVMSVVTLSALLVMTSITGWSVYTFINDFEDSLDAGDPAVERSPAEPMRPGPAPEAAIQEPRQDNPNNWQSAPAKHHRVVATSPDSWGCRGFLDKQPNQFRGCCMADKGCGDCRRRRTAAPSFPADENDHATAPHPA